jgi:hypothetical protein
LIGEYFFPYIEEHNGNLGMTVFSEAFRKRGLMKAPSGPDQSLNSIALHRFFEAFFGNRHQYLGVGKLRGRHPHNSNRVA